jgi:hypothetical protein
LTLAAKHCEQKYNIGMVIYVALYHVFVCISIVGFSIGAAKQSGCRMVEILRPDCIESAGMKIKNRIINPKEIM